MSFSDERRILLVVPKLVRDLEGHALIAYHLRHVFGHDVRLYSGPNTEQEFFDYRPDALVLDFLGWDERAREARLARSVGAKVFVLPTAGVFPDEEGFLRGAGEPNGAYRYIDCYLSWGEYAARAITNRGLLAPDAIDVVGCPRFDFYANRSLAAVRDRESFLEAVGVTRPHAPLVVWCTSTCEYNNLERDPERYVRCARDSAYGAEARLRLEVEDQREQLEVHSRVVLELAERHPDWNFLVKIHPLEHRGFYYRWARQSANIFVAPNLPVREFLFHCDVLLQRGCTTATEAWTLDKPVLELEMGNFQMAWASPEHTAGNHSVFHVEEAGRTIAYYLDGGAIPAALRSARKSYLEKFYFRVDGQASLRCARRIHQEITGARYTVEDQRHTRRHIERAAGLRSLEQRRPLGRLKRALGIGQHRTLRPWKSAFWMPSQKIRPHMLEELYRRYEQAVVVSAETGAEHSLTLSR